MNTRSTLLHKSATAALAGALALSLAACQGEEPAFEAGAEDMSEGELVVDGQEPDEIAVDLPETPVTPVTEDEEGAEEAPAEAETE